MLVALPGSACVAFSFEGGRRTDEGLLVVLERSSLEEISKKVSGEGYKRYFYIILVYF